MYRFFVNNKENNFFILSKEIMQHIQVLRIKKNEKIICIYKNEFFLCSINKQKAKIESKIDENHEYQHQIVLFAAIINIKKFEWLIQKATELGTSDFYPLISKNVNTKLIEQVKNKKNRFNEIIKNASEQSFRNKKMILHDPISFEEAIKFNIENKYIAHEKVQKNNDSFNFEGNVCFYVGPEGGFEENEIILANNNNIKSISLGKRILRAETASIFLLSNIKINN